MDNDRKVFYIRFDFEIEGWFDFMIEGAIDNPSSTAPSKAFRIETSEGESISSGSELSLVATSGSSIDYQIQPESSVVGESTTLYVTLIS
jgi:hypothetical protein